MKKILLIPIVLAVLMLGIKASIFYGTQDTVTFTVVDKERVTKSAGDTIVSYYLIFTENETFGNKDSLFGWKWNSSDIYGSLREGETYEADVYGFRIGFLSKYRNILTIRLTQDENPQ